MTPRFELVSFSAAAVLLIGIVAPASAREPVLGGPCEGCELVFVDMPEELSWHALIAPPHLPGEPLRVDGVVRDEEGRPVAGIVVYAYQTDAAGIYPARNTRHGSLRAWARTDEHGRYRFDTIRPGSYPGRSIPQHIHLHIIEPGVGTYWIADITFDDDPLLTDAERRRLGTGRGGSGLVEPTRNQDGQWTVRRDITLGAGIPGYAQAASSK